MTRRMLGTVCVIPGALLLLHFLTGCASWSNEQLRVGYHVANAADAGMTMGRDRECMTEGNPVLGSDPSNGLVVAFAIGQSLLYEAICSGPARNQGQEKACRIGFLWVKVITDGWNASQLAKGCH